MQPGKLPADLLAAWLARLDRDDPRVVLGPAVGEDACALAFGDRLLIAKTDPITFASDMIGWYAVEVNANDIACAGARPRWFLATVLLPPPWDAGQAEAVFDQIVRACQRRQISLVGGHTEITAGLERPLVVGCMLGEVAPDKLVRTGGAQVGDTVLMTRGLALEGTAVLARELPDRLAAHGIPTDLIDRAKNLLFEPGISVLPEALLAAEQHPVHSLHDPTEGGLATALRELAMASGLGLAVEAGQIPVLPETAAVCAALGLDPLGLLASGSLLATCAPAAAPALLAAWAAAGIPATAIGRMLPPDDGLWLVGPGGERAPLPPFARDELARAFEE